MEKRKFPLLDIQRQIHAHKGLDGWLIYDFRGNNDIGIELLGIDPETLLSRRFFYWIPRTGSPLKIVHQMEAHALKHLPGDQIVYESWQSLELAMNSTLKGQKRIAMEHWPKGAIPVLSVLDAGTLEWLQEKKVEVISSWPIAQHFVARWSQQQFKLHLEASKLLVSAYKSAWQLVQKYIKENKTVFELDLQEHILGIFAANDLMTDHPPIVAVGKNSASPHYCPTKKTNAEITPDQVLQIDLWAKKKAPSAPYADISQVAFIGKKPPEPVKNIYDAVYNAQAAAIGFLQSRLELNKEVKGCQVDDACRQVIREMGYGTYFVHRTGHNIHTMLHGLGPNLDNFETHDTRTLMPLTCYSIEPGIYLPGQFGCRLECNVFLKEDHSLEVTGSSAKQLPCI